MSRWRIKQAECQTCGDSFEWTTRKSDFCRPCRVAIKSKAQEKKRRTMGVKPIASAEKDPLPAPDWAMEKQFNFFYSMLGKRYSSIKDVTSVIDASHYRQQPKTGVLYGN